MIFFAVIYKLGMVTDSDFKSEDIKTVIVCASFPFPSTTFSCSRGCKMKQGAQRCVVNPLPVTLHLAVGQGTSSLPG